MVFGKQMRDRLQAPQANCFTWQRETLCRAELSRTASATAKQMNVILGRVRRSWRIGLIVLSLACGMAQAQPARAEPEQDDPAAIFHVSLPLDGAVIVVTGLG